MTRFALVHDEEDSPMLMKKPGVVMGVIAVILILGFLLMWMNRM